MKKWMILLGYVIVITVGFINREHILIWIQDSDNSHLPLMFLLSALIATIPIIPFTFFAGIMGAKHGVVIGAMVNWFGSVVSSAIYFLLARFFFTGYFRHYLKRFTGINKFQKMIQKNALVAIFIARTIPFIPPPVVNIYSGIAGIAFMTYISAIAIGKVPPTLFVAYTGGQILSSFPKVIMGCVLYLIFLLIIILFYKNWFKKHSQN
ncbi:TVP38/TMEM64 family protein [Peribacillus glennii]|uniref:TVP38/TMEM64 family membrane protein n=1 Tax=Peribacillus glennii TaxID=2303991 RepID=A0A372L6T0_9BACI|nr:VTT domain-containing protein [Peribacillus glennii]RFU60856.1 TVP38/TMEM64 family protein [Peribacillus glennii]